MDEIFLKTANKESFKTLITKFFTAVFFILCASIILEVVLSGVEGRTPQFFGYSVSYVPTESMEPTIMPEEYVLSHTTSFDKVDVGDIIIYKSETGRFIIHRVISKFEDYLICKGDNNPIEDSEKIYPNMVKGIYICKVEFLHIFSGGINQNTIYIFLIVLLIIMVVTQVVSAAIKSQTDDLKKKAEQVAKDKELLLEELKRQVLEEELEKIRKQKENSKKDD